MYTQMSPKLLELAEKAGFENGFEVEGYDMSTQLQEFANLIAQELVWAVVKNDTISHDNKLLFGDSVRTIIGE